MNIETINKPAILKEDGEIWLYYNKYTRRGRKPRIKITNLEPDFIKWITEECNKCWPSSITKWKRKWSQKMRRSKDNNIPFDLSFMDYLELAFNADISLSQIGCSGDPKNNYQLCRDDHSEGYTINNCKFDTQENNMRELHNSGRHNSPRIGKTNCFDLSSKEWKLVSSEEFHNNDNLVGPTSKLLPKKYRHSRKGLKSGFGKGRVSCFDLDDNIRKVVSSEEFHNNDNLVGVTSPKIPKKYR